MMSVSSTPEPRRRIRCKMCRQELATREHMLDHGQLGPASATPVDSPVGQPEAQQQSTKSGGNSIGGDDGDDASLLPVVEHFIRPSELSLQLFSNPTLAALRPTTTTNSPVSPNPVNNNNRPPILLNTKCSGYFVEPMNWMEHFLEEGLSAGKIICPNKKCAAKLGNYDWAGVCCGCKQWVTPGFCINRSKVDEIV